ncbi:MAG: hypothetical protein ACLP9L_08850 [Thermoguttaceae bacterium]
MKKVAFIAGTAYCGSSLLNILLDTQAPAIRGLGERSQTDGEMGGPCVVCNSEVKDCRLYSQWDGKDFYEFNFNHYGCSTLIDSSKRTNILLEGMAREPQFKYYVLHMSKTPHAAAYSIMKHWEHDSWDVPLTESKRDIIDAFNVWIETNRLYIDELELFGENVKGVKSIQYDALVRNPAAVIEEICQWLGEPFNLERLQNWQSPTTHILGGNPGVLMQVLGEKALPDNYLGGKYAEKRGKIFADEAWRRDTAFLFSAVEAYKRLSRKLNPVLAALQYGNSKQIMHECQQLLPEGSRGAEPERRRGLLLRAWDALKPGKVA